VARLAAVAVRRDVASATAALLVVDAWFDVLTAPRHQLLQACVLALLVELPLAVLSLLIAGRAQVQIATTGALPPQPWLVEAVRRHAPGRPADGGAP
jgi:hypothetical protein